MPAEIITGWKVVKPFGLVELAVNPCDLLGHDPTVPGGLIASCVTTVRGGGVSFADSSIRYSPGRKTHAKENPRSRFQTGEFGIFFFIEKSSALQLQADLRQGDGWNRFIARQSYAQNNHEEISYEKPVPRN